MYPSVSILNVSVVVIVLVQHLIDLNVCTIGVMGRFA